MQKPSDESGWTSSANFEGSANAQKRVVDLDSTVGYNFGKHWGVDIGVPLSFVSSSSSTTTVDFIVLLPRTRSRVLPSPA